MLPRMATACLFSKRGSPDLACGCRVPHPTTIMAHNLGTHQPRRDAHNACCCYSCAQCGALCTSPYGPWGKGHACVMCAFSVPQYPMAPLRAQQAGSAVPCQHVLAALFNNCSDVMR